MLFALVDCNNFYAACERVFAPALTGRPVIVLSNNDGCIVARSQEAKVLEFTMGMPLFQCRPLCVQHQVAIYSSNYTLYMSARVVETLRQFTPDVEVYSIDESFLGFSGRRRWAVDTQGHLIRQRVQQWTGLPVSVGFAATKTLAKLANRIAKDRPRDPGMFDLTEPAKHQAVLDQTDVGQVWGIGPAYKALLNARGIETAYQLSRAPKAWIKKHLTIVGLRLVMELEGISCLPLDQAPASKKAIARSRSFGTPVTALDQLQEATAAYTASAAQALRKQGSVAACLQVSLETSRFSGPYYHKGITAHLDSPTAATGPLIRAAHQGLRRIFKEGLRYKRAGVLLTGLSPQEQVQLNL